MIARRVRIDSGHGVAVLCARDNALPVILDEITETSQPGMKGKARGMKSFR
jgi:hypothetical protein